MMGDFERVEYVWTHPDWARAVALRFVVGLPAAALFLTGGVLLLVFNSDRVTSREPPRVVDCDLSSRWCHAGLPRALRDPPQPRRVEAASRVRLTREVLNTAEAKPGGKPARQIHPNRVKPTVSYATWWKWIETGAWRETGPVPSIPAEFRETWPTRRVGEWVGLEVKAFEDTVIMERRRRFEALEEASTEELAHWNSSRDRQGWWRKGLVLVGLGGLLGLFTLWVHRRVRQTEGFVLELGRHAAVLHGETHPLADFTDGHIVGLIRDAGRQGHVTEDTAAIVEALKQRRDAADDGVLLDREDRQALNRLRDDV